MRTGGAPAGRLRRHRRARQRCRPAGTARPRRPDAAQGPGEPVLALLRCAPSPSGPCQGSPGRPVARAGPRPCGSWLRRRPAGRAGGGARPADASRRAVPGRLAAAPGTTARPAPAAPTGAGLLLHSGATKGRWTGWPCAVGEGARNGAGPVQYKQACPRALRFPRRLRRAASTSSPSTGMEPCSIPPASSCAASRPRWSTWAANAPATRPPPM